MSDEEAGKSGSTFGVEPSEIIQAAIATALVFVVRVLLALFKLTPRVPEPLKGTLSSEQLTSAIAGVLWFAILLAIFGLKKWRNRRKHVEGKPKPGMVIIYVAELEGDEKKGPHRTNIIRSLEHELGKSVQILRARIELRLEESGDAAEDAAAANSKAQKYLSGKKGDLLIWGQVLNGPPPVIELRFASAAHDSSEERRFAYNDKFELAANFGDDLGAALAALTATYVVPVHHDGQFVADTLAPTADKLARLVLLAPKAMRAEDYALVLYSYAIVEETIGEQRGENARLDKAIDAYRKLLTIWTLEQFPLRWAGVQNNLGNLSQVLGEQRSETELLRQAVQYFRAALQVWTRAVSPTNWAMAQNNLGNSLARLGERENNTVRLQESADCLSAALEVTTRENVPIRWAVTMANLGNVLTEVGKREGSSQHLEAAINLLNSALGQITREHAPLQWSSIQNNLGNALMELGKLEGDAVRLNAAADAYQSALEERTRERSPLDWAMTQFNLGNTNLQLGLLRMDATKIIHARDIYRQALTALTRETTPLQWAMVQSNLGKALEVLGGTENLELLQQAADAFGAAIQVFTPESNPRFYGVARQNLDAVLKLIQQLGP